jgi:hypothetical protein
MKLGVKLTRTASSTLDVGSIICAAANPRRFKLFDFVIGCDAAPADNPFLWEISEADRCSDCGHRPDALPAGPVGHHRVDAGREPGTDDQRCWRRDADVRRAAEPARVLPLGRVAGVRVRLAGHRVERLRVRHADEFRARRRGIRDRRRALRSGAADGRLRFCFRAWGTSVRGVLCHDLACPSVQERRLPCFVISVNGSNAIRS